MAKTKTKKVKAKKTTKSSKKVKTPVVEVKPAVEVKPVVVNSQTETTLSTDTGSISSVESIFEGLIAQNENLLQSQKTMLSTMKKVYKVYIREKKDYKKNADRERRRAKKDPNRKKREPSGFAVATDISDKLAGFLGVNIGTKLSRTDVTRKVTAYIREKNLQVPTNRRSFIPDKSLGSLLGPLKEVDKDKGFTYFNLQRYITPHITSSAKKVLSASQ
jgi:chromatin remodeling complex protein RSC6